MACMLEPQLKNYTFGCENCAFEAESNLIALGQANCVDLLSFKEGFVENESKGVFMGKIEIVTTFSFQFFFQNP